MQWSGAHPTELDLRLINDNLASTTTRYLDHWVACFFVARCTTAPLS
jgi:hypothetical protein